MNDFIQLKPQSNVYEAETMVEGQDFLLMAPVDVLACIFYFLTFFLLLFFLNRNAGRIFI